VLISTGLAVFARLRLKINTKDVTGNIDTPVLVTDPNNNAINGSSYQQKHSVLDKGFGFLMTTLHSTLYNVSTLKHYYCATQAYSSHNCIPPKQCH